MLLRKSILYPASLLLISAFGLINPANSSQGSNNDNFVEKLRKIVNEAQKQGSNDSRFCEGNLT